MRRKEHYVGRRAMKMISTREKEDRKVKEKMVEPSEG